MLEVKNLQKRYDSDIVLNGVNLNLKKGEIIAIMGPSGCGKSTFIRSINRLVEADKGEIYFQGKAIHNLSEKEIEKLRLNIGFVFQHFNQVKRLSVKQNTALGLIKKGMNLDLAYEKALVALTKVGLERYAEISVNNLSGGEKQRVGIARALVMDPDLILLDEPTASLDPILVQDILEILESITKERKARSMIIVTHQAAFARKVADRIFLMDKGKFIESGTAEEIFNNPLSWIGKKYKKIMNYR